MQTVRLSEASRDVAAALARFDLEALNAVTAQLSAVQAGDAGVAAEPAAAIAAQQRMLAEVLATTDRNIHLLRRLHEAPTYRNER
jgi:acyl-coenzyme A thioesterase PaaI-like protein